MSNVAGADYTIADISIFPWLRKPQNQGVKMDDYPNVQRWFNTINARPAVGRGLNVMADKRDGGFDAKAHENLFGAGQYQRLLVLRQAGHWCN